MTHATRNEARTVDCRGLACPQPVIETKRALEGASTPIVVIVDDEGSSTNVRRFVENQGATVRVERRDGEFHLTIEPDPTAEAEAPPITCSTGPAGSLVVYVSSEGMGRGDEDLGSILMLAFLDTLCQFKDGLSHVIFVNGGARLAVKGSPVLGQLHQLEELGVQILVCGTCLNHFGIADQLAAGKVSNMYTIIETLSQAGRIIRP
jgi:selenium metabolism protein YedF